MNAQGERVIPSPGWLTSARLPDLDQLVSLLRVMVPADIHIHVVRVSCTTCNSDKMIIKHPA